eukprot:TRINITY_DN12230_c0_g1_i1.p1 TRINITY_DN12230_c0_g1~~TRINITY_DN12230_c0_g1_i1.p1  ORF type:complete len:283 (-),score=93.00 TRINITY_DN12230_c0_g1_i1:97-945(-)
MSFSDNGNRRNNNNYGGNRGYGEDNGFGYQSGNSYAGNFNIVYNNIQTFSSNVTTLTKTISKIGTNSDSSQVREIIEDLINKTTILAREIKSGIESLSRTITKEKKAELMKLTGDFQIWVQKFQDDVKSYGNKKERIPVPQQQYNNQMESYQPLNDEYNQKDEELFLQKKQQLVEIENDREFNEQIIKERHQGIKEIETKVVELNEMFRDLSIIVDEQGVEIDNIEAHISNAEHYVSQGVEEVASAEKKQRSARTKLCCIALIIVIVIGVVIFASLFAKGVL